MIFMYDSTKTKISKRNSSHCLKRRETSCAVRLKSSSSRNNNALLMSAGVSTPSTGSKVWALVCISGEGGDAEDGTAVVEFAGADDVSVSEVSSRYAHTAAPI